MRYYTLALLIGISTYLSLTKSYAQSGGETVMVSGTSCIPGGQGGPLDQNYAYQGNINGGLTNFGGLTAVYHYWISDDGLNALVSDNTGNFSICDANLGVDIYYTASGTALGQPPCNTWTVNAAGNCSTAGAFSMTGDCETVVITAPEISILAGATPYTSGASNYAFNSLHAGDSETATFTIENAGTGTLNLTGSPIVSISGDSEFSISAQPGSTIAAGNSTTFNVLFRPACTPGSKSATISISNDDADENPFTFTLSATTLETSITYNGSSYCQSESDPSPSLSGTSGGTYSSTAGLSIASSSGTIDLSASTAGNYTVNYSIGGCTNLASSSIAIKANPTPSITGTLSYCSSDGSTTLSADQAYDSYTWSSGGNSQSEAVNTADNPVALTVTANGCAGSAQAVNVSAIANPTPSITGTFSYCSSDGSTTLSADQAYDSYTWSSGGNSQSEAVNTADNPVALTVTANGCAGSAQAVNVTAIANPTPSITGTLSYCTNDGSTTLSADQAYDSYSWSSGGSAQSEAVNTADNPIALTVTANGCAGSAQAVNVTAIANPTPSITGTFSYCSSDGSTTLSADQAYDSYTWSSGGNSQSEAVNTADNPVALTVTANGCAGSAQAVNVSAIANPTPSITGTLSYCSSDGSTTLSADQAYDSYSWSSGGSAQSDAVNTADNPIALTVTANGCAGSAQAVNVTAIANPTPSITGTFSYCSSDGSTTLSADQAYDSYTWSSGGNSQSEAVNTADNPVALTVTANGCAGSAQAVNVSAIANPTPSITGTFSYCSSDGSTTLSADQAYDSYTWSSGGSAQSEAVNTADNPIALTVTANGCAGSAQAVNVTAIANPTPSITGTFSYCSSDGSTTLSADRAYDSYTWSSGGNSQSEAVNTADNPVALTVTANGCAGSAQAVNVTAIANPTPSITGTLSYCTNDGSTTLSADQAYDSYSWSSGGSAQSEAVNTADNPIALTVTANGCAGSAQAVNVTAIANPTPSITGTFSYCSSDGSTTLSADQAYDSYTWSSGGNSQSEAVNTADNPVALTVTANGCAGSAQAVNVSAIANPTPSITGTFSYCSSDGSTTLSADQAYDSYSWSSGGSAQSEAVNTADNPIALTVTANGCAGSAQAVNVTAIANPTPAITGTFSYCSSDGSTTLSADQAYDSYTWSSGGNSQSEAVNTADNPVALTVTANGCAGSAQAVNVSAIANPTPSITGTLSYCSSDGSTTLSADQAYDSYTWSSGGSAQSEAVNTADNPVALTVTANGCSGSAQAVNVSAIVNPTPSIRGVLNYCSNDGGTILSADQNYDTYLWSSGGSAMDENVDTSDNPITLIVTLAGCSGNSGSVNVIADICTDLFEEQSDDIFTVYPNPSYGSTINFSKPLNNIVISSIEGQLLVYKKSGQSMNIDKLPIGIFILNCEEGRQLIIKK